MKFKNITNNNTFLSWANKKARNHLEIAYNVKSVTDRVRMLKSRAYSRCLFAIMSSHLDVPRSVLIHAFLTDKPKAIYDFVWRREYKKHSAEGNLHEMSMVSADEYMEIVKRAFVFASLVNVTTPQGEAWF